MSVGLFLLGVILLLAGVFAVFVRGRMRESRP